MSSSTDSFEIAYNEIKRIQKGLGSKSLSIQFDKLDPITQNELRSAILATLKKRLPEVSSNVQSGSASDWMM